MVIVKDECPYLEEMAAKALCGASAGRLAPDEERTEAYCKTEEHYRCPMLLGRIMRRGRGAEAVVGR